MMHIIPNVQCRFVYIFLFVCSKAFTYRISGRKLFGKWGSCEEGIEWVGCVIQECIILLAHCSTWQTDTRIFVRERYVYMHKPRTSGLRATDLSCCVDLNNICRLKFLKIKCNTDLCLQEHPSMQSFGYMGCPSSLS